jgi:predicted DNA-binding transcriptional regulator AlpA
VRAFVGAARQQPLRDPTEARSTNSHNATPRASCTPSQTKACGVTGVSSRISAAVFATAVGQHVRHQSGDEVFSAMPSERAFDRPNITPGREARLTISRWVNEPYPPLGELLSAHDVACLTRRPRWMLMGLGLIGQFPKRRRLRGEWVGWYRSEVMKWIARNPRSTTGSATLELPAAAPCHQACLLFDEFGGDALPSRNQRAVACRHR